MSVSRLSVYIPILPITGLIKLQCCVKSYVACKYFYLSQLDFYAKMCSLPELLDLKDQSKFSYKEYDF